MKDIKKLESELKNLKKENKEIKFKLNVVKLWMIREVKQSVKKISKKQINKLTENVRDRFMNENLEEIITDKIRDFFGDYILMNMNSAILENIITWEISFYNLKNTPSIDWLWVVSSYHKSLDAIIEHVITKWFRKFAKKNNQIYLRKNDPIEKALHLVVNKWYILSSGRLFHILDSLYKNENTYDYVNMFMLYLEKYEDIKNVLFNKDFLSKYKELLATDVLWKKRHSWQINFEETKIARNLLIWDFKDKNSLIYWLLSTQDMDY